MITKKSYPSPPHLIAAGGPVSRAIQAGRGETSAPRRGFLRALAALPFIGGGVTLIGAPTAVAAAPTVDLLRQYETWLGIEHARVAAELRGRGAAPGYAMSGPAYSWHRQDQADASTRAALVLSAAGCEW